MEELPSLKLNEDIIGKLQLSYSSSQLATDEVNRSSDERIKNLLRRLGTPPLFTTLRVNTLLLTPCEALEKVTEAVTEQYADRGKSTPNIYLHPVIPDVIIIENRGPNYGSIQPSEVVVDHICGMAVLRGADVFAQGIKGAPAYMKAGETVSVFADLSGCCLKGSLTPYDGPKIFVGNGVAQYSRDELFRNNKSVSGVGIQMTEPLYEGPSLSDLLQEFVFPQNLPSIVCGHVLDPKPGELVLDMCAAPGGKTGHIATLMKNEGRLIAIDKSEKKVQKIRDNLLPWKLSCVEPYAFDSTKLHNERSDANGAPPYPSDSFDKILLDGPCSALGQRPAVVNKMSAKELDSHPVIQKRLLKQAVPLLKPGGTLVYSTCTINAEENENMVAWLLSEYDQMELVTQVPHIAASTSVTSKLSAEHSYLVQNFDPSQTVEKLTCDNDTIGFFIAKLRKRDTVTCET